MRDAPISLRLEPDVRKALQELADQDFRTLSGYIHVVLTRHIQDAFRKSGKIFREHKGGKS